MTRPSSRFRADMVIAGAVATWVLASAAATCAAQSDQWQKLEHPPAAEGLPARAAAVNNEQGYRLQVYMADASSLVAEFTLPRGLRALDEAGCPTFKVDLYDPEPLYRPAGRCKVDAAGARLEIARVVDGAVQSPTMLQLLNGRDLDVIYRLASSGYQFTRFTLKGSKQALLAALPEGTRIVED